MIPAYGQGIAPERTLAQRMAALDKGNRSRTARKHLKQALSDRDEGPARAAALIFDRQLPDALLKARPETTWSEVDTMRLLDLLVAVGGIGKVRAKAILFTTSCSASKTLGGLSPRQRLAVRDELEVVRRRREQREARTTRTSRR